MDDRRLERIEARMDDISDHLGSIDVTLAKQSVLLEEHIKRSNMLEEIVMPIKSHVDVIKVIMKVMILPAVGSICHMIMHYVMKLY